MNINEAVLKVENELKAATIEWPPMRSPHEGYAIILEELDEMWHEVKHGTLQRARAEATQVAAMATRFLVDFPER